MLLRAGLMPALTVLYRRSCGANLRGRTTCAPPAPRSRPRGEPGRVGVGEHARDEGAQPAVVLARRVGLRRRGADERPDAAPRLDDAGALELRVDAGDGVGVDLQLDGELADGRQLVARAQAAGGNRRAQPPFELRVDRRRVPGIDGDDGART